MSEPDRTAPPVTDGMRRAAREQPGGYVYAIDPAFDPDGAVPPHGIVGAWKVDDRGEIAGEFVHNPKYVPSARALELPEPTDALDAVLQRAATQRANDAEVMSVLLDSELVLMGSGDSGLLSVEGEQDRFIYAFSSQEHASAAAPDVTSWQRMPGRQLAQHWPPDHFLYLNAGTKVAVRIPGDKLVHAASGSP